MACLKQSYWVNAGKFEPLAKELQKLIPVSGKCESPAKNKCLERFRRAVNCYYDLFNNGLCNRRAEFKRGFKFDDMPDKHQFAHNLVPKSFLAAVELKMDAIVLSASLEQHLITKKDFETMKNRTFESLLEENSELASLPHYEQLRIMEVLKNLEY